MPIQVAVCGPRHCTEQDTTHAYQVGRLLAQAGAVVICGGGTGVMAAVAAGARAENGLVIGIRPNDTPDDANPDLSAVIVTNMGEARNAIIVWSADAVIAIGGSWGTLSEIPSGPCPVPKRQLAASPAKRGALSMRPECRWSAPVSTSHHNRECGKHCSPRPPAPA